MKLSRADRTDLSPRSLMTPTRTYATRIFLIVAVRFDEKNRAPVWGAVLLLNQMMQLCQSHLAAFAWASALPKGRW